MSQPKVMMLILFTLICLSHSGAASAQTATSLRLGEQIERTIARRETHTFNVSLKADHFLQVVVEQRGIDVVLRLFSPDGTSLGEFDSPNGATGQESLSLIAQEAGIYRIDVSPLEQEGNTGSGRYEIKILDLRPATTEEIDSAKNQGEVKTRGLALLIEVAESLQQIRVTETRVRAQLQAAQLLWEPNEKLARKVMSEAIEAIGEYMAAVDIADPNYGQKYQIAIQMRGEVLAALVPHDPELALSFLRSTRTLTDPEMRRAKGQSDQELQLELSLASQIAAKDPKRALQIAEENLKNGYSYSLIEILAHLRRAAPESASRLAGEIVAKLLGEKLLENQAATNVALNLLQLSVSSTDNNARPAFRPGFLTEQQYRDLLSKAVSAALSSASTTPNPYSSASASAQTIVEFLRPMTDELEKYVPGNAAAMGKMLAKPRASPDPQTHLIQQYTEKIDKAPLSAALETASQAPPEFRDQFYNQIAAKAAATGDLPRARQILADHVANPLQRQQALNNLDQQAIYNAINNGKIEEALRGINNIRMPRERASMLVQVVNQMGANQKRATLLEILEQARGVIGGSGRAEDQDQMYVLFEIVRSYLRLEPKRGFEMLESILDQFNELSAAAVTLNGFGQQYFQDGELILQNGNSIGAVANDLTLTLAASAVADFDRAKAAADRVQRPEVRLITYLAIAQATMSEDSNKGARAVTYPRR